MAARLLYKLSWRCPQLLPVGSIARMAEHALDKRTRAEAGAHPQHTPMMVVFYTTTALANCSTCQAPLTDLRAVMGQARPSSVEAQPGQQLVQDRAVDLCLRALQYFGAALVCCVCAQSLPCGCMPVDYFAA
jgi:hypothetical protein